MVDYSQITASVSEGVIHGVLTLAFYFSIAHIAFSCAKYFYKARKMRKLMRSLNNQNGGNR